MLEIDSREFKFMVRADGVEPSAARKDFHRLARGFGLKRSGDDDGLDAKPPRLVCFVDTREHALRGADTVVRVRLRPREGKERVEVTAKVRSSEAPLVREAKLGFAHNASRLGKTRRKTEADVKPGPVTLWSRSLVLRRNGPDYPGLPLLLRAAFAESLFEGLPAPGPLGVVREAVFHEEVFQLGLWRDGDLEVEAALIDWYADRARKKRLLSEFSFRYATEDARGEPLFDLYEACLGLAWCDLQGPTKTAFAYGER